MTLQLLERGENEGQRTTAEGGNYGNTGLSVSGRGRGLNNVTSYCLENQNDRSSETDLVYWGLKNKEWVYFYHCRVVVFTHCQHTFMSKLFCILHIGVL